MFAAGVPLVESLDAVAGAAGNAVYAAGTKRIQTEVSTGASLTNAMTNTKLFPSMVLQMTQIGEESGSLDGMLSKIAEFYEREVDDAVAALSSLLEPIIIVFLGRRHRRPRRRDVPADLQARRGRLTRASSMDPVAGDGRSPPWSGCCVGSFLNVVIHRLPKMLERGWEAQCAELRGETPRPAPAYNLVVPRSACPSCGARDHRAARTSRSSRGWRSAARCAGCKAPDLGALSGRRAARRPRCAAAAIWRFGATAQGLAACALLWTLLALTMIDFDTQLLPDDLTLPLLWGGLIVNLWGTFAPLGDAVIGAVAGLPVAVVDLLALQADPRQGRHGLRRLQAAGRARRLARLADAAGDRAPVVGRRRGRSASR